MPTVVPCFILRGLPYRYYTGGAVGDRAGAASNTAQLRVGRKDTSEGKLKSIQMIRSVEMERFTVTFAKPFDEVVAGIKEAIGHPNLAEFWQSTQRAKCASEPDDGVHLSYDEWQANSLPTAIQMPWKWPRELDAKVEDLLQKTTG